MTTDDIGIDPRLRRALVNAPDSAVEPPAALDESILRAAHAALPGSASSSARRAWLRGVFARLQGWWALPAVAPVFAVLALSTVIVSMWTRHGIPAPTADEDSRVAAAPAREQAKAPAATGGHADTAVALPAAAPAAVASGTAPASIVGSRDRPAVEKAGAQANGASRSPAPVPAELLDRNEARRDGAAQRARAEKKTDTAQRPKEVAPRARQEAAAPPLVAEADAVQPITPAVATRDAEAAGAPVVARHAMPTPAPTLAPAPSPRSPSAIDSTEEDRAARAPPPQGGASQPEAGKAASVGSIASDLTSSSAVAPGRDAALGPRRVDAADAPPLARALEPAAAWQWRSDASHAPASVDERARAGLARLATASQGRWERADPRAQARAALPDARVIELWRDQSLWATIVIGPSDVTWLDASGRRWRAALPADTLAALRNW